MSLPKLQATLEKRLAQSRIVFWYDAGAEWWTEFDALSVEGVEKIAVRKKVRGVGPAYKIRGVGPA